MATLLTAKDVADRLGVAPSWVSAQARAGRIPHIRLGRYCRFREEALEAWIAQLERKAAGDLEWGTPRRDLD
jgi:excisionase family DNA binding protein